MHVVHLTLVPAGPGPRTDLSSGIVVDLFWALGRPSDRVEHLHAELLPNRILLTVFLLAASGPAAEAAAHRLGVRALATAPALAGWRLLLRPDLL